MHRLTILLLTVLLVVSCSDSNEPVLEPEPGAEMADNVFTYKEVTYTVTEAGLDPQPLQSEEGNEVMIFLLWGESAEGEQLRFDMVINSEGPGLAAGTYPYKLYTADPGYVRWGSVVVYGDIYKDDEELAAGQLEVYYYNGDCILIFNGTTNISSTLAGKFKGIL